MSAWESTRMRRHPSAVRVTYVKHKKTQQPESRRHDVYHVASVFCALTYVTRTAEGCMLIPVDSPKKSVLRFLPADALPPHPPFFPI